MRAILIDPVAKTVTEVDSPLQLKDLYALLRCDTIDVVRVGDHDLYVDDEALLKPEVPPFFVHALYPQPLAGRAVLCRHDDAGETAPATCSVAETAAKVRWAS